MTANKATDNKRQFFSSAFFNSLLEAMSEACGSPWSSAAASDEEIPSAESDPIRAKLTLDGSLRGEVLLEFDRAGAAVLVSKILRQPVEEFGAGHTEPLLRLIKSAISKFVSARAQELGAFTVRASSTSEPPSSEAGVAQMFASDGESNRASILMYMNSVLTEAISLQSQGRSPVVGSGKSAKAASGKTTAEPVNLNLVMDVELNVTLRFGQRQLTLREVLDLTTGSVVELDRQVEEPVELLLDGVVIARGEAVVVDGNYGLRVTEVLQPVSATMLK